MLTIMGIWADARQLDLTDTTAEVTKTMGSGPRRIVRLDVDISIPASANLDADQRKALERAARNCPVAESLHADLEQHVTFTYLNA